MDLFRLGTQDNDTYELEEGEWIPEDEYGVADTMIDEGTLLSYTFVHVH